VDTSALHCFDQRAEIAVAGEQDHLVKMWSELQGIDRIYRLRKRDATKRSSVGNHASLRQLEKS
jgi:hypothetical protein